MKTKRVHDVREDALREYAESVALQNQADIAYLAMMAGVDMGMDKEKENVRED